MFALLSHLQSIQSLKHLLRKKITNQKAQIVPDILETDFSNSEKKKSKLYLLTNKPVFLLLLKKLYYFKDLQNLSV